MADLPDWDCYSEADRAKLEAWTLDQLLLWEGWGGDEAEIQLKMIEGGEAVSREVTLRYRRGLIRQAMLKNDRQRALAVARAAGDDKEELLEFALSITQRGRGRLPGENSPEEYWVKEYLAALQGAAPPPKNNPRLKEFSRLELFALQGATEDIRRIRAIWKKHLGKRNRSTSPTALEIAARRWDLPEERLEAYLKRRK